MAARNLRRDSGVSLIEVLVVLFIMGIMMSMYLPALSRVRARASVTVCENNSRQLQFALSQFIHVRRTFPRPNEWSVDLLPWIEQQPLFDAIVQNRNPTASFPRPQLMACPLQNDPLTDIPGSNTCHYMLVVDREELEQDDDERSGWEITDRQLLSEDEQAPANDPELGPYEFKNRPWFVGPEITYHGRTKLSSTTEGPHNQAGFFSD